jgi:hypothetical protein
MKEECNYFVVLKEILDYLHNADDSIRDLLLWEQGKYYTEQQNLRAIEKIKLLEHLTRKICVGLDCCVVSDDINSDIEVTIIEKVEKE